jgi:hypothetical protein
VVFSFYSIRRRIFACALLLTLGFLPAYAASPASSSDSSFPDQLDVAITKDGFHHLYLLYSQKLSQCLGCASEPRLQLAVGDDEDANWEAPHQLTPPSFDQVNPAMVVDPGDQRTIYAAWLERSRKDVLLAKSSDFGHSWSLLVVARADGEANKPVLSVRGENVEIAFSRDHQMWAASSHDGGINFVLTEVKPPVALVDVLAGGATLDPNGNAYVAWEGYAAPNDTTNPQSQVNLYVSKSSDQGKNWTTTLMDVSSGASDCKNGACEWGYMGAQISITSDAAGTIYALWNSDHSAKQGAERIYFASSTTGGEIWSPKADVSSAPAGTKHVLPAIMAGTAGEVRIAWMDARNSPRWSAYSRSSTNGGATWSDEQLLSMYVPSSGYIPLDNFDPLFSPSREDARRNNALLNVGGL